MMIPLADIRDVAPAFKLPRDKTALMKRLEGLGARWTCGPARRGRHGKLYDLKTLPADIRAAIEARKGLLHERAAPVDFSCFAAAPATMKAEAERRLRLVERVKAYGSDISIPAAIARVADEAGMSGATLRRYWSAVEGLQWSDWRAALLPAYKGRQPDPIDPRILKHFFNDFGRVEQPQAQACYERLCEAARKGGWGRVPCLKTLQNRFNKLDGGVQVLLREGERALKERYPHQARDRTGMLPLDSINSDGREWDVMVLWPNGDEARPVVTLAEDDATHFIPAYEVDRVESGAGYRRVYRTICDVYGIPKKMRYDNTRAAANKALTAGAKGRKRFKDKPDDVAGLLADLGTEVSFAEVENGKTKGAERVFAEIKQRTEKHPDFQGAYTGRSPSEKPPNYGTKVVPLAEFMEILRQEIHRYNTATRERSTVAPEGTSYASNFEQKLPEAQPRRLSAAQKLYFFRTKKAVKPNDAGEIFIGQAPKRHRYYSEAVFDYAVKNKGKLVVVRYDENDLSAAVYVEDLEGRCIAEAVPRLTAGAFNSASQAAEHRRARAKWEKSHKAKKKSELEMAAIVSADAASHEPQPDAPTEVAPADVITAVFGSAGRRPKAAKGRDRQSSKPNTPSRASPPTTSGPDYEKLKRGEEILARMRAG